MHGFILPNCKCFFYESKMFLTTTRSCLFSTQVKILSFTGVMKESHSYVSLYVKQKLKNMSNKYVSDIFGCAESYSPFAIVR